MSWVATARWTRLQRTAARATAAAASAAAAATSGVRRFDLSTSARQPLRARLQKNLALQKSYLMAGGGEGPMTLSSWFSGAGGAELAAEYLQAGAIMSTDGIAWRLKSISACYKYKHCQDMLKCKLEPDVHLCSDLVYLLTPKSNTRSRSWKQQLSFPSSHG